jgi:outer membrane protein
VKLRGLTGFVIAVILALSAVSSFAGDKLAYVSLEKILRESPQAIEIGKKLQKEFATRGADIDLMQKQLNDRVAALDKNSLTLSEADRRSKEDDLSNSNLELQRKKRELSEDVDLRKGEELAKLQDKINKAVTAVAETEGYDLVIYGNVAYADKAVDITDKVMKALGN